MPASTYTVLHVLISLIGIGSGFVVMYAMLTGEQLDGRTALFLVTTAATSVTEFGSMEKHVWFDHDAIGCEGTDGACLEADEQPGEDEQDHFHEREDERRFPRAPNEQGVEDAEDDREAEPTFEDRAPDAALSNP